MFSSCKGVSVLEFWRIMNIKLYYSTTKHILDYDVILNEWLQSGVHWVIQLWEVQDTFGSKKRCNNTLINWLDSSLLPKKWVRNIPMEVIQCDYQTCSHRISWFSLLVKYCVLCSRICVWCYTLCLSCVLFYCIILYVVRAYLWESLLATLVPWSAISTPIPSSDVVLIAGLALSSAGLLLSSAGLVLWWEGLETKENTSHKGLQACWCWCWWLVVVMTILPLNLKTAKYKILVTL